jgi:hypothetical protein
VTKETDAAAAMSTAERLLDQLDSCANSPERPELLAVASFFLRLAAALLLESVPRRRSIPLQLHA